jgi:hypothetical protein
MYRKTAKEISRDLNHLQRQICETTVIVMSCENVLDLSAEIIHNVSGDSPFNHRATRGAEVKHRFSNWSYGIESGYLWMSPVNIEGNNKLKKFDGMWCKPPRTDCDYLKADDGFVRTNSTYTPKVDERANKYFTRNNAYILIIANSLTERGNCVWIITNEVNNTMAASVLASWALVTYVHYGGKEDWYEDLNRISIGHSDRRLMGVQKSKWCETMVASSNLQDDSFLVMLSD